MIIRNPSSEDEGAWKCLWAGYNEFYETNVPAAITQRTWERILDPASPMFARLAEEDGHVVGFAVCVLHEGTWTLDPICYLEDLFIEPNFRGRGAARRLIEDLIVQAREKNWSRVYWHTRTDNPARRLYDEFVKADDFVRYRLILDRG
jgi:GNAT superfamily N-acetyltransferase